MEHLQEPSGPEKILESRLVGRWLPVLEEVPEQGERRAQVAELWVVHRQEADELLEKVQGQWRVLVVE